MTEEKIELAKSNGDYEDKIYELNEVYEDGRANRKAINASCD